MLLKLFFGIILYLWSFLHLKHFSCNKGFLVNTLSPIEDYQCTGFLVNTFSPIEDYQYLVMQYSREQLFSYRSVPRQSIMLDIEVLKRLKDYHILHYRDKRAGIQRSRGVDYNNLQHLQPDRAYNLNQNRKSRLKFSTVNTRSIRGESADLLQHVFEQKIDLCVVTETWLRVDGDAAIRGELSQNGFRFDDVPRPHRKGGGVALLYRENLQVTRQPFNQPQSFECAQWRVNDKHFSFLIVGIYRPPYSEKNPVTQSKFLNDFTDLECLSLNREPVVILGDFNTPLLNNSCTI